METTRTVHRYKKFLLFLFVVGMMHSFIGFLFDLITCQVKFNKKEEKVSLISYKYTVIKNNNICFRL